MKKQSRAFLFTALLFIACSAAAQPTLDSLLPVRGLCIAAPVPKGVDSFVTFIHKELAPANVNMLILRVDYNYQYASHPELRDNMALSKTDVKKIAAACRANNIKVIPQVNLLGHQSWANKTSNLLRVYPQFDETPHIKMPEKYVWPNADSLYCKSYCPLHPGVHNIIFALVDEICDAFEADAFHAGMDEVFYIGDGSCPRCSGKDIDQLHDMISFRKGSSREMKLRFQGMIQTVWSDANGFLNGYYRSKENTSTTGNTAWDCFRQLYREINKLSGSF